MPVTPVKSDPEGPSECPGKAGLDTGSMGPLPEPFTPSLNKALGSESFTGGDDGVTLLNNNPPPLPDGLTVMSLKERLKIPRCGFWKHFPWLC
jgi:hypothetical protein